MRDLNQELEQITNEINAIDKRLDEIVQEQFREENETPFGLLSIVDNCVKIELMLEKSLFTEEELDKLGDIAQDIQDLLIAICKRENE
jgi:hypothetical protein